MSIVKMSRLKLLAMQSDRDRLIHELMLLGCTEITESAEKLTDPDWAALARKEESKLSDYRTKYSKN